MLFDSSLRKDLARTFGATLIVILTIVLTMMLIRTLGRAAGGEVSPQDVVLLLGYTALGQLATMLSLSLFIATAATLNRMYRDSEMTIWFASGVGLRRFVRPVLRTAAPVLLVVALSVGFVWPWVNEKGVELLQTYERRSDLARVAPGQFQSSRDGRRVFFVEKSSDDARTGRNIFILADQGDSESVTSARSGRIEVQGDGRFVVLERGQRNEQNLRTGEKTVSRFDTYQVLAGDRALAAEPTALPKALKTIDLLRQPTPANQGELAWRLGIALGAVNLLLLAVGLAATNPRRAGNWNLLFALLAFVVYFNLVNLSQAWVANGKASLGAVLLVEHGGMLALALALLWWRDHAASRGHLLREALRRRSPAAAAPRA